MDFGPDLVEQPSFGSSRREVDIRPIIRPKAGTVGAPGPRGSARPGYRARRSGSTQRERRTTTRTADTYAMSFSFLSGRTFRELSSAR